MDADYGGYRSVSLTLWYEIFTSSHLPTVLKSSDRLLTSGFPIGIVRAPLATTALQVLSRIILVWAVVDPFPFVALSPFYSSMLFAWSVTEVIRYSYFALNLSGWHPRFMTWLRYNTFFVLYPIGISSEWALCYQALGPASKISDLHKYTFYVILFIYFPGKSPPSSSIHIALRAMSKIDDVLTVVPKAHTFYTPI